MLLTGCASSAPPLRDAAVAAAVRVDGQASDSPADRMLVRSAHLAIERGDPEAGLTAAAEVAKRAGGWVQRATGESVTLMVPATQLDGCLEQLKLLGEVTSKSVSGEDVTEEYRDLTIRLDNYQRERERYLDLLSRAANVTEAATVEKEVERVTVEVERLKGRIQYLDQGVRYSSIDASFERPIRPGPVGWIFYGLFVGVKWLLVWN